MVFLGSKQVKRFQDEHFVTSAMSYLNVKSLIIKYRNFCIKNRDNGSYGKVKVRRFFFP